MTKRVLCSKLPHLGRSEPLSESEAHHASGVLRLRDGDVIQALDGKGHTAWVRLRTRQGPPRIEAVSEEEAPKIPLSEKQTTIPLTLEIAILKGDAMEWVIEKAVELGVQKIIPLVTLRTVVRIDRKGPQEFQARWNKIAQQALKQCGRLDQMEVSEPVSFESHLLPTDPSPQGTPLSPRLWCDEETSTSSENSRSSGQEILEWLDRNSSESNGLRILIGPEGGWDPREREILQTTPNTVRTYLGPVILRAETAALYSISLTSAFLRRQLKVASKTAF
ncbi:MAG: 16S rRNA (uracil(1498)-N(3))-methyltransferase [Bdellovibrio sp.]|nr:16S rRNA (uracil(1498)-N(3))-methyltransferase [Bdellovibrio sp.]